MKEIWNRTLNEVEPAPSMVIPCKTDQISEKFQPDPQRCQCTHQEKKILKFLCLTVNGSKIKAT